MADLAWRMAHPMTPMAVLKASLQAVQPQCTAGTHAPEDCDAAITGGCCQKVEAGVRCKPNHPHHVARALPSLQLQVQEQVGCR